MNASLRDQLRQATIGTKAPFRSERIKYNGHEFEIRQPSIKARAGLRKRSNNIAIVGGEPVVSFDALEFLIWGVIENTYVPDTNERVFDDSDYETLVAMPTGGFMDVFGETAQDLMNVEDSVEDAKKPSRPTTNAGSSSASAKS